MNPYSGITWENVQKVTSVSHVHARTQTYFNNLVYGGVQHFAISNYYPSEPFDPLSNWFTDIPENAVSSPNAEHHNFGIGKCHFNGLGCTLVTGNERNVSPVGMATIGVDNWKSAVDAILGTLVYTDGGGITVNHPTWTGLNQSTIQEFLDYDERVLGIEICNSIESDTLTPEETYAIGLWDEILKTGRRCWGFCVPDHRAERSRSWAGRNILLINGDVNSHSCLKAYRDGAFYGKLYDSDLAFSDISFDNNVFTVSAPLAESITVVIDGNATVFNGNTATVKVSDESTYVRAEASMPYLWNGPNGQQNVTERIFTNPITISKPETPKYVSNNTAVIYDI